MVSMKKILFLLLTLCSFSGMAYSDITWSSPVAISTALTDAVDPRVVIDSSGNATAIWVEGTAIVSSSLPLSGSWTSPVTLSNVLNTASTPRLGVDASGNVTALWIESNTIQSAVLPFGGSWGAASAVSASGATNPVLAVDGTGRAVAVWLRSGFVESSTRISGTWSLVSVLSTSGSASPHVAISNFGTAIAAWKSVTSGADVIVTNILTLATNTWGINKNVFNATAAFRHNYPKVAIDANGNASVAWFRYNLVDGNAYENVQVAASTLGVGATNWTTGQLLSEIGIRNPADLTLKLRYDAAGDIIATWTNSYDGETFVVESSQRLYGTNTWPGSLQPAAPSIYSFGFDVAVASGTALLVNMAWDGSSLAIQSQETSTTNPISPGWTSSTIFSTGDNNAYPSCAMASVSGTFEAVAVWVDFDGANTVIHAASGSVAEIDPPSSVSASQNLTDLEVYQDYYNTITWTASSDPDVVQYNIFRNGVFFTATDPGTLTVDDHNQVQNGTVTYGVAALTSSFRHSQIITFTLFP